MSKAIERIRGLIDDYIAIRDPTFPQRVRGASAEEIDALAGLMRHELPKSYRTFLEVMGNSSGGLVLLPDFSTDIEDVRSYYEEDGEAPANCLVFNVDLYESDETLCLQLQGAEEPKIVRAHGKHIISLFADGLAQLLYRDAFSSYELAPMPFSVAYEGTNRDDFIVRARAAAIAAQFHVHWFSDSVTLCASRENIGLLVYAGATHAPSITVTGETHAEVEAHGTALQQTLRLGPAEWLKR